MKQRQIPREPGSSHSIKLAPSLIATKAPGHTPESVSILVAARTLITTELFCSVLSRDARFSVHPYGSNVLQQRGKVFDVALISAGLENQADNDGIELARQMQNSGRVAKTVVQLDQPTRTTVLEAFRAGARGVFCSRQSIETLSDCLWSVHSGQVWASNEHLEYLLQALGEPVPVRLRDAKGGVLLTKREEGVVSLVTEGLTNREIADRLKLSEHTIKNYLFRIFDKLGVSNRSELIIYTLSRCNSDSPSPSELQMLAAQRAEDRHQRSTLDCSRDAAERLYAMHNMLADGPEPPSGEAVSTYMWLLVAQAATEATHSVLRTRLTSEQVAESRRLATEWIEGRVQQQAWPPTFTSEAIRKIA